MVNYSNVVDPSPRAPPSRGLLLACHEVVTCQPASPLYNVNHGLAAAGGGLHAAGLVAAATGAGFLCETFFARCERGAGQACPERLVYFPKAAEQ